MDRPFTKKPSVFNLYASLPQPGEDEDFLTLCSSPEARIERIVSNRHASPEGFWYDQSYDEWVMVLKGSARLAFSGDADVDLADGDSMLIPAHCRHRIESTGADTIWLVVRFAP